MGSKLAVSLKPDWDQTGNLCRTFAAPPPCVMRHVPAWRAGAEIIMYVTMAVDVRQPSLFHRKVGKSKQNNEMLNSPWQRLPSALPQKKHYQLSIHIRRAACKLLSPACLNPVKILTRNLIRNRELSFTCRNGLFTAVLMFSKGNSACRIGG